MTPTIADAIVTAGGAGVMTKMKSAAGKMVGGAKSVIIAAAATKTAGANAVREAIKRTSKDLLRSDRQSIHQTTTAIAIITAVTVTVITVITVITIITTIMSKR